MSTEVHTVEPEETYPPVPVDLRNRFLAALLAWLWPGAGHWYQGRIGKSLLFMTCILTIYFWGLAMGDGHVVYASFRRPQISYPFVFQVGVGLPAFPAVVQSYLQSHNLPLLFGSNVMAPPSRDNLPRGIPIEQTRDELSVWHEKAGVFFELGTLYTMVAGILNMLAMYDACLGPAFTPLGGHSHTEPSRRHKNPDE